MFRCVMTTPFGSAVAPDVKMISTTVSRVGVNGASDAVVAAPEPGRAAARRGDALDARQPPHGHGVRDRPGRQVDLVADEHDPGLDDARDLAQEVGRGPVVDRHDDGAAQHRPPEGDNPLRAVLAPDHDLVVVADAVCRQCSGKRLSGGRHLGIGPGSDTKPVVVNEKRASCAAEVGEEVEKGLARHRTLGGDGRFDETGLTRG